jgi:hypothetical protein
MSRLMVNLEGGDTVFYSVVAEVATELFRVSPAGLLTAPSFDGGGAAPLGSIVPFPMISGGPWALFTEAAIDAYVAPYGWRVCNGTAPGDPQSPIFYAPGRHLPRLNDERFLMGSASVPVSPAGGSNTMREHAHANTLAVASSGSHGHGYGTLSVSISHTHPTPAVGGSTGTAIGTVGAHTHGYGRTDGNTGNSCCQSNSGTDCTQVTSSITGIDNHDHYAGGGGGTHCWYQACGLSCLLSCYKSVSGTIGGGDTGIHAHGPASGTIGSGLLWSATAHKPKYYRGFMIMRIK